ncbi:unnamed protein product [Caenorhabditis angaria]|uniref:SGNH domain-containing protein n=1 Tax=Caenorhabditis angaria TaxID=860376 RepID=A0A9P1IWN0_9PELO|nr:unnamed protein product [Caenorhabditis angaria]
MTKFKRFDLQGIRGLAILAVLGFHFFPDIFPNGFLGVDQPLITLLTGIVILSSTGDQYLLSNKTLVYTGDISYSLYLIHWPNLFLLETLRVLLLSILLIVANLLVLNRESISDHLKYTQTGGKFSMSLDNVEKQNREWDTNDIKNLAVKTCSQAVAKKYCNNTGLDPQNPYKILLIGNSWTKNHGNLFYQECKNKMNTMVIGSNTACEPFRLSKEWKCKQEDIDITEQQVQKMKPDYLFHLTRHISYGENFNESLSFENDEVYQKMWNQAKKLLKFVKKKMYLLNAIPTVKKNEIVKLVQYIRNNTDRVEIDKKIIDLRNYSGARARYAQLLKDCGEKCELIDYHDLFYRKDSKTFRFFDENGFEYLTKILHLSPLGLEKVRPIWKKICDHL